MLEEATAMHGAAWRFIDMPDGPLDAEMARIRQELRRASRREDADVSDALGVVIAAAARSLGLRPFPVQVMGALALFRGNLIEMQTGEGKTLTAAMAAVLFAWFGRSCHVVTVNDYLARRDRSILKPLYDRCGVTTGYIEATMAPSRRKQQYEAAVVYVTSKELAGDFLKDRLEMGGVSEPSRWYLRSRLVADRSASLMLNGLDVAVVDEADSVLVDDAVSSLLIARPSENRPFVEACKAAVGIAGRLEKGIDYLVNDKRKDISLTQKGIDHMTEMLDELPAFWRSAERSKEIILQALVAAEFYHKGSQYVVREGKLFIVDEFTGRLMPGRKWRNGLHQVLEVMEGIEVSFPDAVAARVSFQRFFRFYSFMCGMTGTAGGVSSELWRIYGLNCIQVPTNRPSVRKEYDRLYFLDREIKERAVVREVALFHREGRPVLVGTRSVEASERLAGLLEQEGLHFNLLNAILHEKEAEIIARAGEKGSITIATNMAGRGTDIKLGHEVAELGGLHVVLLEHHEAGRIDRQFFGRCARQGDPGSVRAFLCVDDELIQRFLPAWLREMLAVFISRDLPYCREFVGLAVSIAQMSAQSIAFRSRVGVLRKDDWIDDMLSFSGSGLKL
ncbi:MAG: hypothetical protein HGB04_10720 [Chlorobiaceae bacterium]|nr:hypothetical protein [Chlorobiaceae bacterium]